MAAETAGEAQEGAMPLTMRTELVAGFLVAIAAVLLVCSATRLMWNDELMSFYLDSLPTLRQVWHAQLHTPISLDPPLYHVLSHGAMQVLGANAVALRLPATVGFVLMLMSLLLLVRRLGGRQAALLAMPLPLCMVIFRYAVEGRPYGLMLGLQMTAMLLWLRATQVRTKSERRLTLVALAVCVFAAIATHYFGFMILLPLALGEVVRMAQRRRLDWAMAAALAVGAMGMAIDLRFSRALLPYRTAYLPASISLRRLPRLYLNLFVNYDPWPHWRQVALEVVFACVTVWMVVAVVRRVRREGTQTAYAWVAVGTLALLPVFGLVLGRLLGHAIETRYVVAAPLGWVIAFAVAVADSVPQRLLRRAIPLVYVAAFAITLLHVRSARAVSRLEQADFVVTPAQQLLLRSDAGRPIYVQDVNHFFIESYLLQDADLRARLTYLYDAPSETRWLGHNTFAVTATQLRQFLPLHVAAYDDVLRGPAALVVVYHSELEWVEAENSARGVRVRDLGPALGGELLELNPPAPSAEPR